MATAIGNSYIGAAAGDCAQSECETQQLLTRVIQNYERVKNATRRVRTIADRLVGERGEPEGKTVPRPLRSGLLGKINDQLDDFDGALRELEDMVIRIEGL